MMKNKSETNARANPDVRSENRRDEHQNVMPDINPQEELVFTKRDVLKMILGGYISLLPALLAIAAAFLLVYLLVIW